MFCSLESESDGVVCRKQRQIYDVLQTKMHAPPAAPLSQTLQWEKCAGWLSYSDNPAFPISTVLCMRLPRPWHVAIWQSKCKQEIRLPHSLPPSLLSPDACVSRWRCVKNKLAKSQYNVMLQQRRWLEIPAHFGC